MSSIFTWQNRNDSVFEHSLPRSADNLHFLTKCKSEHQFDSVRGSLTRLTHEKSENARVGVFSISQKFSSCDHFCDHSNFTWNIFNTSPALFRFAPIRRKTYELANLLEYIHNFARNLIKITRYSFASSLAFLRTSYAHYAQNLALPPRPNYSQKMKKVLSEVSFIWLRTCNPNWAKYFLTPKQAML